MLDTLIVWLAAAFTCIVGVVAVMNAIRANKIKHGEISKEVGPSFEAHA